MASGEASKGAGSIRLTVSEGYIYPIRMVDGSVRDAYVFPLLEGLKVSRFAVIDAHDYNNRRVFKDTICALRWIAIAADLSAQASSTTTSSTGSASRRGSIAARRTASRQSPRSFSSL